MKQLIFKIYRVYDTYFPLNRGKYLLGQILYLLFGNFLVKSETGFYIEVMPHSLQDKMCLNVSYSDVDNKVLDEVVKLKEGETFVDVGANIGLYSLIASSKVKNSGKVFAVEPSFREFKRLLSSITNNQKNNICSVNYALSNYEGTIMLSVSEGHSGLNKIVNGVTDSNKIMVPVSTFDSLLKGLNGNKNIDLIKIDVEGAELLVIQGMSGHLHQHLIKKLIVEVTPKYLSEYGHNKEQLYDTMTDHGYKYKFKCDMWQYDEVFHLD
ncbi:MAG: hypothetical protein JWP57_4238 [Spirosoma sp.]|nr:hypothetical protein [Spirosoma sp.]